MRCVPEPLPIRRSALTPWRALLLATLLLAAQAAGLVHRVAHGPQGLASALHTADSTHTAHGAHGGHGGHGGRWGHAPPGGPSDAVPLAGEALSHEAGTETGTGPGTGPGTGISAECRLYDQLLGHADGLFGAALAGAVPVSAAAVPLPQRPSHRRSPTAAFQARAPPLA